MSTVKSQKYLPTVRKMNDVVKAEQRLTLRQLKFIHEFVQNGGNASAAAVTAGYSERTAGAAGFEILKKPRIQSAIEEHVQNQIAAADITFDWKILMLKKMIKKCLSGTGFKKNEPQPAGLVACITELNRMQHHRMPDQHLHEHKHLHADLGKVEKLIKQYRKEF